jgi:undecaprenyl-diphosphatase
MEHTVTTLSQIIPSLESLGNWTYLIIFLLTCAESIIIVGTFIPGVIIVIAAGILVAQGMYSMFGMICIVALGAIAGDALSYILGSFGTPLVKGRHAFMTSSHLQKGKEFLKKHGNKGILVSRFFGPLRGVVPFVAGLTGIATLRFFIWDVVSCFVWAISLILLGYFSGSFFV